MKGDFKMKKILIILVCLVIMFVFVGGVWAAERPEMKLLIISGNCVYTPDRLTGGTYVGKSLIEFKLDDGSKVILISYQALKLKVEKYEKVKSKLEAQNYIFID